jgi:putative transposase
MGALEMAIRQRGLQPGLLFHCDCGSQYVSGDHRKLMEKHGMLGSMSGKGNCYDNTVAQTILATLKKELVHRRVASKIPENRITICAWLAL